MLKSDPKAIEQHAKDWLEGKRQAEIMAFKGQFVQEMSKIAKAVEETDFDVKKVRSGTLFKHISI